jgi:hypothetical protein
MTLSEEPTGRKDERLGSELQVYGTEGYRFESYRVY